MIRNGEQKKWKKRCNSTLRKVAIEEHIPTGSMYKRYSGDIWDSPSDGKKKYRLEEYLRK